MNVQSFPSQATPQQLMAKHVLVAAGTQTAAGIDLAGYCGELDVIINAVQGSTGATLVVSLLQSTDNTTFATWAGSPVPVTITGASLVTSVSLDTRATQRYVQAKALTTDTTATWDVGVVAVGVQQTC